MFVLMFAVVFYFYSLLSMLPRMRMCVCVSAAPAGTGARLYAPIRQPRRVPGKSPAAHQPCRGRGQGKQ